MMNKTFQGRPLLPGTLQGEALVTRQGFNAYASFYNSLHDQATSAICAHAGNQYLYGKNLTGKIICLPETTGSTSAGAVWMRIAKLGVAPKAMLFARPIDSLAAGGLLMADIWANQRIITVDRLGEEFLHSVADGDMVEIFEDGSVIISGKELDFE
jgi:predicted aconitase with swiveling domain